MKTSHIFLIFWGFIFAAIGLKTTSMHSFESRGRSTSDASAEEQPENRYLIPKSLTALAEGVHTSFSNDPSFSSFLETFESQSIDDIRTFVGISVWNDRHFKKTGRTLAYLLLSQEDGLQALRFLIATRRIFPADGLSCALSEGFGALKEAFKIDHEYFDREARMLFARIYFICFSTAEALDSVSTAISVNPREIEDVITEALRLSKETLFTLPAAPLARVLLLLNPAEVVEVFYITISDVRTQGRAFSFMYDHYQESGKEKVYEYIKAFSTYISGRGNVGYISLIYLCAAIKYPIAQELLLRLFLDGRLPRNFPIVGIFSQGKSPSLSKVFLYLKLNKRWEAISQAADQSWLDEIFSKGDTQSETLGELLAHAEHKSFTGTKSPHIEECLARQSAAALNISSGWEAPRPRSFPIGQELPTALRAALSSEYPGHSVERYTIAKERSALLNLRRQPGEALALLLAGSPDSRWEENALINTDTFKKRLMHHIAYEEDEAPAESPASRDEKK